MNEMMGARIDNLSTRQRCNNNKDKGKKKETSSTGTNVTLAG